MTASLQKTMLMRGQALHAYASQGTALVAIRGRVQVCAAPVWLGEQAFKTRFVLGEGEAHFLQQDGWVEVRAVSEAEIICVQKAKPFRKPLVALMTFLASVLTGRPSLRRWQ